MGYDAAGTLTIDGHRYRGTAQLEQDRLLFRGDTRLAIPLNAINDVRADDGKLIVSFGERRATIEIGPTAAKWAQRIAQPPTRLAKLGLKRGMRVALIDIGDDAFRREVARSEVVVESTPRARELDAIFFGVSKPRDLDRVQSLAHRIKTNGAIWIVRAKGAAATVSEAQSMAAGKRAGLVDVKVVSFSNTYTAEKYVIPVEQRARAGHFASPARRTRGSVSLRGRT
jgi:hypothetical protein